MRKVACVVEVKPECVEEYKRLHSEVWPEVIDIIKRANIENYSIFLSKLNDSGYFLFSYFEYTGENYESDMAGIAAEPITKKWWSLCKPCLKPLNGISMEQCWYPMEQVFDLEK